MSTQPEPPPAVLQLPPRLLRELVGLALLLGGVVLLVVSAWQVSPWLGVALIGAALTAGGVTLVTTSATSDEG